MGKPTHSHRRSSHGPSLILPLVTLGFYCLRRFQPRWLYTLTAIALLALWVTLAFVAGSLYDGGELLVAPLVFVMAGVTFCRLVPPARRTVVAH